MRYARPGSIEEALALLSEGRWRMLAGGTDVYPAQVTNPIRENVLDLNGLSELRHIAQTEEHFLFGARATWTDILRAALPPSFDALKLAAREVGSVQIQNIGTLGGNLCNASPAADGVPPLLALDADVELRSVSGTRILALGEFILGNRRLAIRENEIVTTVRVPKRSAAGSSHFMKLGSRRYLVISIAMAAARIAVDGAGKVVDASIAIGACSPVALRLPDLERALKGEPCGVLGDIVWAHHFSELSPIDDVRATAEYRRQAAREIARRAVIGALPGTGEGLAA